MACGQSLVTPEILQRIEETRENKIWMNDRLPELKKQYANKFIAIYKKKIIANDSDFKILIECLKKEHGDISTIMIEFIIGDDYYLVL
jgi:hypothetical protein